MPRQTKSPKPETDTQVAEAPAGHYRTIARDSATGVELGENMQAKHLVFTFSDDPGLAIKAKLKENSFYYNGKTKEWVGSGSSEMKSHVEFSKRLQSEFVAELGGAEQGRGR